MPKSIESRSKYLSFLLRHKPEAANLSLDREGWCALDELLSKTDFSLAEVYEIVGTDEKTRYSIQIPENRIRANQGHSTSKVRITFDSEIPPAVLYHGTSDFAAIEIIRDGLKAMKRHHVHLSCDKELAATVGGRRRAGVVVFEVDAERMVADGYKFFVSTNQVWFVDLVPPKYLKEIT